MMRKSLLLIFASLLSIAAHAEELKMLTWNVFMLPPPIKFSLQQERTKLISSLLSNSSYDLIVLQESFSSNFTGQVRPVLKKKFPYQYAMVRKKLSIAVFGPGLLVLSRHPFTVKDRVYFSSCSEEDCFASKGMAVIEISLPTGKKVQVGTTHLQAGRAYQSIRMKQLQQIKNSFEKLKVEGIPQILAGDINIDAIGEKPNFEAALNLLDMKASELEGPIQYTNGFPIECYSKPGDETPEWIDHVLYHARGTSMKTQNTIVHPFSGMIQGKDCPLSDHYAVETKLRF